MSFNHENVVWQSKDGLWNIGLFKRVPTSENTWDNDYDPEWDDDFDFSVFSYVRTGFGTEERAMAAYSPNPGSHTVVPYKRGNTKDIADYEDMAKAFNNPAYAKEREERKAKEESRELVKRVRDRLRQEPPVLNGRYLVRFSKSKLPSATGMMEDREFLLSQQGDWLGFETETVLKSGKRKLAFLKVWNVKTNSQAPNVINVQRAVRGYFR